MHCYDGLFFYFILDNRADQDRDWTGRELDGGTQHFGTTIEYGQGDLLVPLPLSFFLSVWLEAEDWLVQRAVGSTADECDG